jgi:hypothetical protein
MSIAVLLFVSCHHHHFPTEPFNCDAVSEGETSDLRGLVLSSVGTPIAGATVREPLNKSELRDAVEKVLLVDTLSTLIGGDESGETADVRGIGVAEQGEEDAA